MEIIIDQKSGFCFGVERAIQLAEKAVSDGSAIYCLGDIVHNAEEVGRLAKKGVIFIDRDIFFTLSDCKVLFRAHGEPPETYIYAKKNNIEIIDATCPVVLKLQEKVRRARVLHPEAQLAIFGRKNHPEVVALRGQTQDTIIIENIDDLTALDYTTPIVLFAQTTKDKKDFSAIESAILENFHKEGLTEEYLISNNSICGQVANRGPWLAEFSKSVDTLIFVGGKNSSNSKVLFEVCRQNNPSSYFVTTADEVDGLLLKPVEKIGISGATSTPQWLIEEVSERVKSKLDL
jgi:4-hydroxy-3-methylbut-2-enyl diphosphate reductase